jgi:uncharacterized protein with HEPN domain
VPSERDTDRLLDIQEHIGLARQFVGSSRDQFNQDKKAVLAVTRCLEIISEASRHLDGAWKAKHPELQWSLIAGAGNVYRHDYPVVRPDLLWDTVQKALPPLATAVDAELRNRGVAVQ